MIHPFRKFKTIRAFYKERIAYIILNRPRVANRVNDVMVLELAEVVGLINQDDSVLAAVLTGNGNTFSAGWGGFRIHDYADLSRFQAAAQIAQIQKPVIASVNGDAIGQGLELLLSTDIRITSNTSHFGMPQISYGLLPWDGGSQRLPRIVGKAYATEMLLTGNIIDADEALRRGLVSSVVGKSQLADAVNQTVNQVVANAPLALMYAKEALMVGMDLNLGQSLRLEADLNILLHGTKDRAKGIQAFLQKRSVTFLGE